MADNPFFKSKESEYQLYAIAFLKKLRYLDYELIDEDKRTHAYEKHREEFNEYDAQKNLDGAVTDEMERQADPALKDAKIDCTVGMIARILREDPDSKLLSNLPKFYETLAPHDTQIEENTGKFQHEIKQRNKEKINMVIYCEQVLRAAEKTAEQESIAIIDNFNKLRKHRFRTVQALREGEHFDFAGFKRELGAEIERLEDALMNVELKLQESLQVSTNDFQERVKKINEDMKNKTNVFISEVATEMDAFSTALKTYALQEYERFLTLGDDGGGESEQVSDTMLVLMSDLDVLNQHLEASKENVDSKVTEQETIINREQTKDWRNTETRITEEQHHRNRTIVQEIIKSAEKFRREIRKRFASILCRGGDRRDREGEEPVRLITYIP